MQIRFYFNSSFEFQIHCLQKNLNFQMMEDLGLPRPEAIPPCLACLGPPPPKFDLPPPPRPPWEANDGCAKQHTVRKLLMPFSTFY